MSRIAYIAALLYLPLSVVYLYFASDDSLFWNKYYFSLDKLFIASLLVTLYSREVMRFIRYIYLSALGYSALFVAYIFIDFYERYNLNRVVITIYCLLAIIIYSSCLILYKNDSST